MPIHDQGYRRYGGTRAAVGRAWQVIAGAGIRSIVAKRAFIALMLFAWAPFVVRAVQIYVSANFQQAAFLAPKGETFREFLDQQGVFVFFVTIWVGAGLIANDRRANALQLYLSKPLSAAECADVLHFVAPGRVSTGPVAIADVLRSARGTRGLPWRMAGRLLALRPVLWLAWPAYRLVARNRHRLPGGTAACELPRPSASPRPGVVEAPPAG